MVELQREFAIDHIELEQGVARRQIHSLEVGNVPCAHNDAARVGVVLYCLNRLGNLVDEATVVVGPGAPLEAIDVSEVAILVGPLILYSHTVFLQIFHIGVAIEKPQQLVDNRLEVQFLGGKQWESVGEIETHLVAENAACAGAGAVAFERAVGHHMIE